MRSLKAFVDGRLFPVDRNFAVLIDECDIGETPPKDKDLDKMMQTKDKDKDNIRDAEKKKDSLRISYRWDPIGCFNMTESLTAPAQPHATGPALLSVRIFWRNDGSPAAGRRFSAVLKDWTQSENLDSRSNKEDKFYTKFKKRR